MESRQPAHPPCSASALLGFGPHGSSGSCSASSLTVLARGTLGLAGTRPPTCLQGARSAAGAQVSPPSCSERASGRGEQPSKQGGQRRPALLSSVLPPAHPALVGGPVERASGSSDPRVPPSQGAAHATSQVGALCPVACPSAGSPTPWPALLLPTRAAQFCASLADVMSLVQPNKA